MSDISLHRVVDIHHVDAYIIGEVAVGELGMCIEMNFQIFVFNSALMGKC